MVVKKPTLRDVSRAAGVSVYTVSRALSNQDGVSEASREHVLEIAHELGYVPNRAAQELRKNSRRSVGVITASTSNPYYIDMMKGVERTLRRSSRTPVVADIASEGHYTAAHEDETVRNMLQSRVAGVITTLTLSDRNMALLDDWGVPVVFVDSHPPASAPHVASVTTDNVDASTKVGTHLAEHGYQDWLFVAYPPLWTTRPDRERGLREAARRFGAKLEVLECDNDLESAYRALSRHVDAAGGRFPRAVCAGNNPMLHATLRVLHERGVRVPDDVAVIAFDEFVWAPLLDPPVTVLDEDSESIGAVAAHTLTRLIDEQIAAERDGRSVKPAYRGEDRHEVTGDLILRRSCGCARR